MGRWVGRIAYLLREELSSDRGAARRHPPLDWQAQGRVHPQGLLDHGLHVGHLQALVEGDLVGQQAAGAEVRDLLAQPLHRAWVLQHVVQDGAQGDGSRVRAAEHVGAAAREDVVLGEPRRVLQVLVPELGQEVQRDAVGAGRGVDAGGRTVGGPAGLLLAQARQVQVRARADDVLGELDDVLAPRAALPVVPVLQGEQDAVQRREDADQGPVEDHVLELRHDAADVLALVEEADALGVGHLGDDIKGEALEPAAHVQGLGVLGKVGAALCELLEEDVADLVDVRLVLDN